MPPDAAVAFADEIRIGLHGQVRRRWTPKGFKLRQRVEIVYVWRYLLLAVTPDGRLWWEWLERFRKEPVAEVLRSWKDDGPDALVWDNAPSHTAKLVQEVGLPLIRLPSYSPELNPAERIFQEIRRHIEGEVYGTLDRKKEKVEAFLIALAADPARVRCLAGWDWITDALSSRAA